MAILFTCKRCGAQFEALPPLENNVPRLPLEITTENVRGEWEFCCAGGCLPKTEKKAEPEPFSQ